MPCHACDCREAQFAAARVRLSEMERERNETSEALLSIREYLEKAPCSGLCDPYGICAKCSAESETYAEGVSHMTAELEAARAVVEAAAPFLQNHLDDFAHGNVGAWSAELEEAIGWSNDFAAYKLGRALAAYDAATKGTT